MFALSTYRHVFLLCGMLLMMLTTPDGKALASPVPDNTQLYEMIKGLQDRVASLEADVARHKQEAVDARNEQFPEYPDRYNPRAVC